jgi:hypothetical protein
MRQKPSDVVLRLDRSGVGAGVWVRNKTGGVPVPPKPGIGPTKEDMLKRLIAALSSGVVGAALLVLVGPAAPVGATVDIVQAYNCTGGVAANVTITGVAAVSLEEPKEKVTLKNVLFTVTNPFGVAITVKHIVVTVPDPATVTFVSGSTAGGPPWVFTHPGISTDTHLGVIPVVPAGGTFSSALMKIKYVDNGTDPPGPGVINWFGGTIRFKVTVPAGIGNVVCVPGALVAFATVPDGV